jgi:hypothetical protein
MPSVSRLASGVHVVFEEYETDLLRALMDEMRTLLSADIPRSDRVIQRLFPQAYESADDERAYREMTGDDLTSAKLEALATVAKALGDAGPAAIDIPDDELGVWLSLLTDLRLALGTRLEVTEERMDAEIDPADADAPAWSVLHWLGYVQETILQELRA